jgi:hypothetical protein
VNQDSFFHERLPHADRLRSGSDEYRKLEQPVDHVLADHAPSVDSQVELPVGDHLRRPHHHESPQYAASAQHSFGRILHGRQTNEQVRAHQLKNAEFGEKMTIQQNVEVKRSVSNGEILRVFFTTYLCSVDPYPQSQQRHKIDNFWNKAKYLVKN